MSLEIKGSSTAINSMVSEQPQGNTTDCSEQNARITNEAKRVFTTENQLSAISLLAFEERVAAWDQLFYGRA